MSYDREQWEEVAFQVINEMDGSVRSGYYPTGEGLVDGNIAIDLAWGNFPIQPNEGRPAVGMASGDLGVLDSHKIPATEWNGYPNVANSRNYMVTGVEYLPGVTIGEYNNIYEYTSQNNLNAGDIVNVYVDAEWGSAQSHEVLYADATKFRTTDEMGEGKLTGLYGRVDVLSQYETGHTLYQGEGEKSFYGPQIGLYNYPNLRQAKVTDYLNHLRDMGVDPELLKDLTFSGGENEWDNVEGTSNDDGCILYSYIPAEVFLFLDANEAPVYGSDLDGLIAYSAGWGSDDLIPVDGVFDDYLVVVFSNDPRKDNEGWW